MVQVPAVPRSQKTSQALSEQGPQKRLAQERLFAGSPSTSRWRSASPPSPAHGLPRLGSATAALAAATCGPAAGYGAGDEHGAA